MVAELMKKQKGFTFIESLLVIVVLCTVGFGAYVVWNHQNRPDTESAVNTILSRGEQNTTQNEQTAQTDTTKWLNYRNTAKGFSFYYPAEAKLSETNAPDYFTVTAEVKSRNNPSLNAYEMGGYKIQIQASENKGLDLKSHLETTGQSNHLVGKIVSASGIERASGTISEEEAQGPSYDIHWLASNDIVLSVSVFGNYVFNVEDLLKTISFL